MKRSEIIREDCPICGDTDIKQTDEYKQVPPPETPSLHTHIRSWSCGHKLQQWWFQRFDNVLAWGPGEPPVICWKDYDGEVVDLR